MTPPPLSRPLLRRRWRRVWRITIAVRSWTWRRRRAARAVTLAGWGRIYDARRGRIVKMKEAPLEGALSLNPRTLSPRCKRVLARYLSVESQAGRVRREGGRRAGGLKGIGEGLRPGRRECNLQIREGGRRRGRWWKGGGRDEFLLPAWPCQGNGGAGVKLRFGDEGQVEIVIFFLPPAPPTFFFLFQALGICLWRGHSLGAVIHAKRVWSREMCVSGTDRSIWNSVGRRRQQGRPAAYICMLTTLWSWCHQEDAVTFQALNN